MKTKERDYYNDIIKLLKELKTLKPEIELGNHIATATSEYKDIWGVSDKELLNALTKYKAQFELFETEETFQEDFSLEEEED